MSKDVIKNFRCNEYILEDIEVIKSHLRKITPGLNITDSAAIYSAISNYANDIRLRS